ncbi:hypothetical protein CC1G_15668 [Coprinopsis cinerea okayama7|uniref:Uncharacterized protein n=1 Tax=Coprinopsis cinerea (strain Okayama-7 / 130 / ATCC MYA-4618 / FGSC 9003) TaxID=240176 RepID=D6RQC8_COPC7|nr:hypothetical protein CC1G_15668 [Coprinopsis cinerea okayama7\|eukprot:XP_002910238.1 hypothetical protein CC1G_15668 [Coprinopsis cinerea okayama7\
MAFLEFVGTSKQLECLFGEREYQQVSLALEGEKEFSGTITWKEDELNPPPSVEIDWYARRRQDRPKGRKLEAVAYVEEVAAEEHGGTELFQGAGWVVLKKEERSIWF